MDILQVERFSLSVGDWIAILTIFINSAIGAPLAWRKVKSYVQRRRLVILLGSKNVTIHIPSRDVGRNRNVVAQEDYESSDVLRDILRRKDIESKLLFISPGGSIELVKGDANVIICGPKNSHVIEEFFTKTSGFAFRKRGRKWELVDQLTEARLPSPMDYSTSDHVDYAYLGRVNIPSWKNPVILICGIHAIGTLGAVKALDDNGCIDKILKTANGKNFCCVVWSRLSEDRQRILKSGVYIDVREL